MANPFPFPQAVTLNKTDTCLTYALKRCGHHFQLENSEDLEKFFVRVPYNGHELKPGTILLWAEHERITFVPVTITESGQIISRERVLLQHYGVYEGNGIVSDCTINSRDYNFCRSLRLRQLDQFEEPTHFLMLKDEHKQ